MLSKTLNKSIQKKSHLYFVLLFPIPPPSTSPSHFLFPLSTTAKIWNDSNLFPGYVGVWNVLSLPHCMSRTKILYFWYEATNRFWNCKQLLVKLYWSKQSGLRTFFGTGTVSPTVIMADSRTGKEAAMPLLPHVVRKVCIMKNILKEGWGRPAENTLC